MMFYNQSFICDLYILMSSTNVLENKKEKLTYKFGFIGDIIRKLLDDKHITIQQLAQDINLTRATIYNIIEATSVPKIDTVISLAEYFKVSVGQIVGTERLDLSYNYTSYIPLITDSIYKNEIINNKKHIEDLDKNFPIIHDASIICAYQLSQNFNTTFFKAGCIITITNSFMNNQNHVLVDDNGNLTIKHVIKDGNEIFLESLITNKKELYTTQKIIGVIKDIIIN